MFSSEYTSDDELRINNCGIQPIKDKNWHTVRIRSDYSLMFVSEGKATMIRNGTETKVLAGEAMLYLPGAKQDFVFKASDKSVNKWVHFTGRLGKILDGDGARIIKIRSAHEFESDFDRMVNAFCGISENKLILCEGYLKALIAIISESEKQSPNSAENRLYAALCYIHTNIGQKINIDLCAEMCYMSRDRFNHVFREHTGMSPGKYIRHILIERAKSLLCDTGLSVSACAESLGFSDTNYFCRIFRNETGISPFKYKNEGVKKVRTAKR